MKDNTSQLCHMCKKGTYQETSLMDDMDGTLHCTNCNFEISRWQDVIDSFACDYAFLSNFARYPNSKLTLEHLYQLSKVDPNHADYKKWSDDIVQAATPGQAKRLGQNCPMRPNWDMIKYDTMKMLVLLKFQSYQEMYEKLMATGNAHLIEGNTWHDNYWGNCTCKYAACQKPGLNKLGQILMKVRSKLNAYKNALHM